MQRLPGDWTRGGERFSWAYGQALPLPSHVSLARPALSCAHYFQATAMQAKEHVSTVQKEQLSTWKNYNGMEWCVLVTH